MLNSKHIYSVQRFLNFVQSKPQGLVMKARQYALPQLRCAEKSIV
jgi:hypothetical protein